MMSEMDASNCEGKKEVFDFRKAVGDRVKQPVRWQLGRPVYFVGFMGAGKTSVARKVARLASMSSVDVDLYIERQCDKKVAQIFQEVGEEGFRAIETHALRELSEQEPNLIACGGGIVLAEENRQILQDSGFVIYLEVTAEEAARRISDTSTRPLFRDLETAQRVIDDRLSLYESVADATLDTGGRSTGSLAHEVIDILKNEGILWQQK